MFLLVFKVVTDFLGHQIQLNYFHSEDHRTHSFPTLEYLPNIHKEDEKIQNSVNTNLSKVIIPCIIYKDNQILFDIKNCNKIVNVLCYIYLCLQNTQSKSSQTQLKTFMLLNYEI